MSVVAEVMGVRLLLNPPSSVYVVKAVAAAVLVTETLWSMAYVVNVAVPEVSMLPLQFTKTLFWM